MKQFGLGEGRRLTHQIVGCLLTFDRLVGGRIIDCAARSSIIVATASALRTDPMHYPLLRAGRARVTLNRLLRLRF